MGRHSIPDPDDSAGEQGPDEPETQRFGQAGDDPDYGGGYGESGYGTSDDESDDDSYYDDSHDDDSYYNESGYDDTDYDGTDHPGDRGSMFSGGAASPPRGPGGPAHGGEWEGGEWTGSHRAVTTKRRGVSIGVIAALITVVVVVGAFILWRFFGDAL